MPPRTYADLEIILRKRAETTYDASFRYNGPGDEAEQRFPSDDSLALDAANLRGQRGDAYAQALSKAFFTDTVKSSFSLGLAAAERQSATLRVRLSIEPSAPELHALHWETLQDPRASDSPLFTGANVVFSRFLASASDWKPIRLRPKADLSALVVVANPPNLGDYEDGAGSTLAPVAVDDELNSAKAALANVTITQLASALGPDKAATLNNISDQLRKGFDILYLVCHGTLTKENEPLLFLEEAKPTLGKELVQRIRELDNRPRLVVLASCQSAGKAGGALSALGPRLAEAGVPAVVAMQGNITMETAAVFMPKFFTALAEDGQIDYAMSIARGQVRQRPDSWMPALFMRLRNGRIWYVPGFQGGLEGDRSEFEQWQSICGFVRGGECVPIIGPDVAESVFGTTRELAADIASAGNVPLDPDEQSDIAKVTQYLLTQHSPKFAQDSVLQALVAKLKKNGERILGRNVDAMDPVPILNEIAAVRSKADDDPMAIVASLNAKVFVNASNSGIFSLFLRQATINEKPKDPVEIAIRWRDERRNDLSDAQKLAPLVEPTVEKPLLYYVFGKTLDPATWVLTEDDFFDYLIQTTRYNLMPPVVSAALVTGSLLFLGFPLDDWKFRVLFRLILAKGGKELLSNYNHVAVQVDPGETTIANARRAKSYMQRYFRNSKIDIYWGTATDFLRDLNHQLKTVPAPVAVGGM